MLSKLTDLYIKAFFYFAGREKIIKLVKLEKFCILSSALDQLALFCLLALDFRYIASVHNKYVVAITFMMQISATHFCPKKSLLEGNLSNSSFDTAEILLKFYKKKYHSI